MKSSLDKLRQDIAHLEGELEAARQQYAEALWAQFQAHPAERVTIPRVVHFYLEHEGPAPTEEIAEFLGRIKWPSKTSEGRFVSALGTHLRQREDLFRYDKKKRVWHRKSG